jgi:hypothetical protein
MNWTVVMSVSSFMDQSEERAVRSFHNFHGLVAKVRGNVVIAFGIFDLVPHLYAADKFPTIGVVLFDGIHRQIVDGTATTAQHP